jgi:DNA-directed RNA polymerase subunit alpha
MTVTISVSGKDQLGDFQKFISGFQVLNPELVICNLDPKSN